VPRGGFPEFLANEEKQLLEGKTGSFSHTLDFRDELGVGSAAVGQAEPALELHIFPFDTRWQALL
jgi:hypothetical protein